MKLALPKTGFIANDRHEEYSEEETVSMAPCDFLFKVLGVYLALMGAINSASGRFLNSVKYIHSTAC